MMLNTWAWRLGFFRGTSVTLNSSMQSKEAKRKKMQQATTQKENVEAILKPLEETLKSLNKEIAGL